MLIECGECGAKVADMTYVCPRCGLDVRAMKSRGCGCGNCWGTACGDDKDLGPADHPCLAYSYYDTSD